MIFSSLVLLPSEFSSDIQKTIYSFLPVNITGNRNDDIALDKFPLSLWSSGRIASVSVRQWDIFLISFMIRLCWLVIPPDQAVDSILNKRYHGYN
ncbi:MAG: hypothetical protein CME32_04100 [Gimesia sp.]|nr:hypothetical protein [Gimesia sp.]